MYICPISISAFYFFTSSKNDFISHEKCSKRAHFNLIRLKCIQTRKTHTNCQFFNERAERGVRGWSSGQGGWHMQMSCHRRRQSKQIIEKLSPTQDRRHKAVATLQPALADSTPPYPTLPYCTPSFPCLCPVPTINVAISRNHESHANENAEGARVRNGRGGRGRRRRASCRGAADEL